MSRPGGEPRRASRRVGARRSARAGVGYVLLGALLFSTAGTAQAVAGVDSTPLGVGAARLFVGTALLVAVLPAFGQRRLDVLRLWRRRAALVAGACIGLYQWAFFAGVKSAGVALGTVLVIGSAPVFAGALTWIMLRRRPARSWLLATSVGVAGLVLLSSAGLTAGSPVGVVLSLTAGLCVAIYTVAVKTLLDRGVHPTLLLASTCGFGGVLLLPVIATQPLGWLLEPRGIALAVYLGVCTLALANTLQLHGHHALGPAPVNTLMLAEPVLATVFGVVLLGEPLTALGIAGLVLVLAGLVIQSVALARSPRRAAIRDQVPIGVGPLDP